MNPTHRQGLEAAKRVVAATEAGRSPDWDDTILMHTYQLSLELREVPPPQRLFRAELACELIMENTRESLAPDDEDGALPEGNGAI